MQLAWLWLDFGSSVDLQQLPVLVMNDDKEYLEIHWLLHTSKTLSLSGGTACSWQTAVTSMIILSYWLFPRRIHPYLRFICFVILGHAEGKDGMRGGEGGPRGVRLYSWETIPGTWMVFGLHLQ